MRPLLVAGLATAAACGGSRLEVSWQADSTGGRMNAPAAAIRCDAGRLLVTAVLGDTGFGVLLAGDSTSDSVEPGAFPVADPGAGPLQRPGAALSLRRPGEGGSRGYQGREGSVELARQGDGWSGRLEGRLVSLDAAETLRVEGRFAVAGPVPAGACDDSAAAGLP